MATRKSASRQWDFLMDGGHVQSDATSLASIAFIRLRWTRQRIFVSQYSLSDNKAAAEWNQTIFAELYGIWRTSLVDGGPGNSAAVGQCNVRHTVEQGSGKTADVSFLRLNVL